MDATTQRHLSTFTNLTLSVNDLVRVTVDALTAGASDAVVKDTVEELLEKTNSARAAIQRVHQAHGASETADLPVLLQNQNMILNTALTVAASVVALAHKQVPA